MVVINNPSLISGDLIFIAEKGTSGRDKLEMLLLSYPFYHQENKVSVIKNALEPHEYQQTSDMVKYKGGTFKGAEKANNPSIDGWLDGVPVQLKEVQG